MIRIRKNAPLRKAWRAVARWAPKDGLTIDERSDSVRAALFEDLEVDVGEDALRAIHAALARAEKMRLSPGEACAKIESMRDAYPASGFLEAILEHIQVSLHFGKTGERAFINGVSRAAIDHASAGNRQVEERYHGKEKDPPGFEMSMRVRQNLGGGLRSGRLGNFGAEVMQRMRGELDAGPKMP